jgi:hypothetical protein
MEQESLLFQKRDTNGYISILTDSGWKKEHVWVIEQFLKRSLNDNECVHHINGIKTDNNIFNLCLFTHSQHAHFHIQIKQFGYTNPRRLEVFNNIIQVKLREQDEKHN